MANYFVSTSGNDSSAGSEASPFRTIQKFLNIASAGDTCYVRGGTYSEALVAGVTGISGYPITIRNYGTDIVTVFSGDSRTFRTNGRKHYYTLQGLRLLANRVVYDAYGADYTIDFQNGIWDGETADSGNIGHRLVDCYIEGAVRIYGRDCHVLYCTMDGKNAWKNGIWECYASSHDCTYIGNVIGNYLSRGIWSMQYCQDTLIDNNIIYNIGDQGIDSDGAGHPVYRCTITNNIVHHCANQNIQMENSFGSIVANNILYSGSKWGLCWINYGYGPDFTSDGEYRDNYNTNGLSYNNLIYDMANAGIFIAAACNVKLYNNTIHNVSSQYGGIVLYNYGGFNLQNVFIKNNILPSLQITNSGTSLLPIYLSNNLYYNGSTSTHYYQNIGTFNLAGFQARTGQDLNSIFANPLYTDESGKVFSLQSGSPAINAGVSLAEVLEDIVGRTRPQGVYFDIGAYEFEASDPITFKSVGDIGRGTDTLSNFSAILGVVDVSSSLDAINIERVVNEKSILIVDTGFAIEAFSLPEKVISVADIGAMSDSISNTGAYFFELADIGRANSELSIGIKVLVIVDDAIGLDSLDNLYKDLVDTSNVLTTEQAIGADFVFVNYTRFLEFADTGNAIDAIRVVKSKLGGNAKSHHIKFTFKVAKRRST